MTPARFAEIRVTLGVSLVAYGRALGYQGHHGTVQRLMRRFEAGSRDVPKAVATAAEQLATDHAAGRLPRLRYDGVNGAKRHA